ncbi:HAD family phosphatase [Nitrosopumilus sp. b2]|uniref:HAD family hydrolase n=1 Tax=Nitrosopumilus sp. b2 TaxID=2109908 RepID=UPI0015F5C1B9|nr:HAD family phosphatase [Nitrosopumilus sp. b2]
MIKAILYDLDGVLVDATEWHYESLNDALKEVVGFVIERDEHITTFNGIPTMKKLEILHNQGRLEKSSFEKIWEKKQEKTFEVIERIASIDPNKIRLHEQTKNFKKACITNSIRKSALLMLKKTGQLQYMDFVISNEDVSSPKPSPEGYNIAIKKFNLSPKDCLIIEDSPKGLEAAKQSGANVYEVSGYHEVTLENILTKINYFNTS